MPIWLEYLRFPKTSAEFVSRYSLPETIVRLRDAASRSNFFSLKRTLNGEFYGTTVHLHCCRPLVGNLYSPMFTGSISEDVRGIVLSGRFAVRRWAIINRNAGLIAAMFVAVLYLLAALARPHPIWPKPLIWAGVLALLYFEAWLAGWKARRDVAWLSRQIGRAIGDPAAWPEPPSPLAALSGR